MSLEADQRVDLHVLAGDASGAAEIGQVDDEGGRDDLAAGAADQLDRGFRRSAGRDQVVDQQDLVARWIASAWISMVSTPYSRL